MMADVVETTVEVMGDAYPELVANKPFVLQVAASEEERFGATFGRGMALFDQEVAKAREQGSGVFPGEAAFRLHDTFGFPQEITTEVAREQGLEVDLDEFNRLMGEQRRRSKEARKRRASSSSIYLRNCFRLRTSLSSRNAANESRSLP